MTLTTSYFKVESNYAWQGHFEEGKGNPLAGIGSGAKGLAKRSVALVSGPVAAI